MMKASELLRAATERTGLDDFGPPDFREGLTVLVEGIAKEAEIRPSCEPHLEEHFIDLLTQRLWFASDAALHPEIAEEQIKAPLIILSLPRTGSTKLHRILGSTGDFQTLKLWSTMKFARIPGQADGGLPQRIADTQEYEAWLYEQSPAMLIGHPIHAEEPEEDCFLMESTFRHPTIFGRYDTPSYARWVADADPAPAYDYLVSVIKYLQWQDHGHAGRPWLFKDPNHLGHEPRLVAAYGAPKFIVTHRDPVKCIPSVTSTVMAMRKIYSDIDNRQAFAGKMVDALSSAMSSHMAWRDSNPDIPILDLSFKDVVENSRVVAGKIYNFSGMRLSEAAIARMADWEEKNPKGRHGNANYSAAEVGSTDDAIRTAFANYADRFGDFLR